MRPGDRVPTGIEGLDTLLRGGFPLGTVNLVSGPSGSGKSLLCMHYIYSGVENYSEPGLYITLEENRVSLVKAMKSFGLNPEIYEEEGDLTLADLGWLVKELGPAREVLPGLAGMDLLREKGRENLLDMDWLRSGTGAHQELGAGFVGFGTIRDMVDHLLEKKLIRRLAVDSMAVLGLMYKSPESFRKELFSFGRFLRERKLTSVLVTDGTGPGNPVRFGVEHFLTDSHLCLDLRRVRGEMVRTVSVQKMRFGSHDAGVHPLSITSRGMEINTREYVKS